MTLLGYFDTYIRAAEFHCEVISSVSCGNGVQIANYRLERVAAYSFAKCEAAKDSF